MKHYWVGTPKITTDYWMEPSESYEIWHGVMAENRADARVQFVKQERADFKKDMVDQGNWLYHIGRDENPYKGLKVQEAMCKHGVCNCEIEGCSLGLPQDPEFDYCGECIREADAAAEEGALFEA